MNINPTIFSPEESNLTYPSGGVLGISLITPMVLFSSKCSVVHVGIEPTTSQLSVVRSAIELMDLVFHINYRGALSAKLRLAKPLGVEPKSPRCRLEVSNLSLNGFNIVLIHLS